MALENTGRRADSKFLIYIAIWVVFGLVALTSASAPAGYNQFHDTYYFVKGQILKGLIPGLIAFLILAKVNYHRLEKISWPIYLIVIILQILIFIPGFGLIVNGARSWVKLGPLSFEPSEFAKMAIILIAATLLSDGKRDFYNWKTGILPVIAVLLPSLFLIMAQPDIGTLSILVVILFTMMYVSKIPRSSLLIIGLVGLLAFVSLMVVAPYRVKRLTTFLHPELDPKGIGYQVNQSFLAIGSGGFWGLGLGQSRQKFQYLPEVSTDSIYPIVCEEMGFMVAGGLVILILLVAWRGLLIARESQDEYGKLLTTGIVIWLVWQSFLNICAAVGLLPLTGVPLPFVSHGGSALFTALAGAGIVANVSKFTVKKI